MTQTPTDEDTPAEPAGDEGDLGELRSLVLGAAWEAIQTPMLVADQDTVVLLANPAALREFAVTGMALGRPVAPIDPSAVHLDGTPVPETARPLRRALAGEQVHDEEIVVAGRDGSGGRRYVISGHPFQAPDGRCVALLAWRDVTQEWEAENTRQAALDRLHRMLEGAADYAILMLGVDGRVLTWSSSAERLLHWTATDAVGRPFAAFFTPEDRAAGVPAQLIAEATAHGRVRTEGERVRGDGSRFWARGLLTAQRSPEGELLGFVKVTHDVTEEIDTRSQITRLNRELRDLNQQLEGRIAERTAALERQAVELASANRELEAFSYSVSHDLRAPLRAMSGFARLLAEEHTAHLDDEGLHYLTRIQASAAQMGQLIEGLLSFSRLQRQRMADDPLDMTELARSAWESVTGGLPPGTAPALTLDPLAPARGDRQLVTQVWLNLLENAVKFTRGTPDAEVRVSGQTLDGAPAYCVVDNGVGFAADHVDKLFQPFQRLHRAEDFPGTGIGLALVHRIVHRHGGTIDATAAPGRGAQFRFTLGPA